MTDPLNILSEIVFASANDVLAGLQTWEEHEAYLRQTFEEYAAKGIKLPLDLTTEKPDYEENHRDRLPPARQPERKIEQKAEKLPDIHTGILSGLD